MTLMKSRSGNNTAKANAAHATVWLWLTAPIAILLTLATLSELLVDGLFRGDAPYLVAQAVGQDFVTLFVALPALVIGAIFAARGSGRGRLVWLGPPKLAPPLPRVVAAVAVSRSGRGVRVSVADRDTDTESAHG